MIRSSLTPNEITAIDDAVQHYSEHQYLFKGFSESLLERFLEDDRLSPYIHFIKSRLKSEKRLREKLKKKALEQRRGTPPNITSDNLFTKINDLAGIRLIHLHTNQLKPIIEAIKRVLDNGQWTIVEGPIANCWDVEYEQLFSEFGIKSKTRDSLYSSIHYVLQANKRTKVTIELQVRTLMEEAWGEVSHRVGYEDKLEDELVIQQLKVLARLTSGSTRLVDSIFRTYESRRLNCE